MITRVMPHGHEKIEPALKEGRKVFVTAHGNSLRGLVKYLDHLSDDEVTRFNIPTGFPLVYELGDEEETRKATEGKK